MRLLPWTPSRSSNNARRTNRFAPPHGLPWATEMRSSPVDIAIDVAREAGGVLVELFTGGVVAEAKGRFDIVTSADRVAEALIARRLRDAFPLHAIVAEESGRHDGSAGCRWYVDPLDGTKNFARGNPSFAVSLALEDDDQLVVAVVFDPIRGELFA